MTLAYWCVLIAIFLPYLGTATAKFLGPGYDRAPIRIRARS